MIADVEAVMAELDAHRERFETFCRSLSAEELARPVPKSTWQVRDFIAHLGTIDGPVERMFVSMQGDGSGEAFRTPEGNRWDVDDWNDGQVLARRGTGVEELLAEAATARASLRKTMAAFTEADVSRTMRFGGDSKRPPGEIELRQYLRGWCKHDPMHAMDMARALPEKRTPELEAWFDDPVIRGYQAAMNRE